MKKINVGVIGSGFIVPVLSGSQNSSRNIIYAASGADMKKNCSILKMNLNM